jgi:rhodanese-related sulfurtransferase
MADSIAKNELKENINQYTIIDVRETDELENGKIENSLSMPLGLVIRNIKQGKIEGLKNKKICVYCASGYRGNIAADELSKSGFVSVNLEGGFKAWIS